MKTSPRILGISAGVLLCAGILTYSILLMRQHARSLTGKVIRHEKVSVPKPDLQAYVAAHADSSDPKVQDAVAASRMHLAFAQASESWKAPKNPVKKRVAFETARKTFLAAANGRKGTGAMNPDFGTVTDQAAYQAAVCLVGEGKPEAAKAEFISFMNQRPLSPLCKACYRRLVRLNGGKTTDAYDALMQRDIDAQDKEAKFELSVCGPKAIEAVLPILRPNSAKPDYREIAKLCGTTNDGTSIEGMRKGLKALGIMSYAVELNAPDFAKLQAPAIVLRSGHYLFLSRIGKRDFDSYDPTTRRTTTSSLPAADDASFQAAVITFEVPTLNS